MIECVWSWNFADTKGCEISLISRFLEIQKMFNILALKAILVDTLHAVLET